jgi:acyl-CoA synthetase (AMP-forming)/AMP-acid ligase II
LSEFAGLLAVRAGADGVAFRAARGDRVLRWSDLAAVAAGWQTVLADDPGTVALAVADPLEFAASWLGLLAAGATLAPLDAALGPDALAAETAEVGASVLVTDRDDVAGPCLRPVLRSAAALEVDGPAGRVLLRSSGTTGPRKQILLDEARLLHTAGAVAAHHGLGPGQRGQCPLPLFHVNAEVVGLLSTVVAGSELVLDDRFHRDLWSVAERHAVTWVNAVPAVIAILAQGDCGAPPPSVRFVRSASAPLATPVLERFERLTGLPVVETYGMTEAASQICANPVVGVRKPGSVGLPVDTELQIVDEAGVAAPSEVVGRVRIRGAGVVPGGLPGGWLDTGDLGRLDADGYVFLTGRVDDVINRGGEKVFPGDVEAALLVDERVTEAVVVAAPDEVLGSVPVAFVVTGEKDPAALAADLMERAARTLSRPRRPAAVHVVADLPHGPTGKVSRAAVRAAAADLVAGARTSLVAPRAGMLAGAPA